MSRPRGRPLKPRTDTERLNLLVKLIGFGRARRDVVISWSDSGRGPLVMNGGICGEAMPLISADENGDLRALLDRALSPNAKKRGKR
jgi:hypothetical protein